MNRYLDFEDDLDIDAIQNELEFDDFDEYLDGERQYLHGVCVFRPPSYTVPGKMYHHKGRKRGAGKFRHRVSRGSWAVPNKRSQGGPNNPWSMARMGIHYRTGIRPTDREALDYIGIITSHRCNKHLGGKLTNAFLAHWDRSDRRKRVGAGGAYGIVWLPNNRKARKLFKRVNQRFYSGS